MASRGKRIEFVRRALMTQYPGVRGFAPWVRDARFDPKVPQGCPSCGAPCLGLAIPTPDEPKRVNDVLLCSHCEHFTIFNERAA